MKLTLKFVAGVVLPFSLLMGCQTIGSDFAARGPVSAYETKFYSSDEDVLEGARQFQNGSFGNAERHFRAAVERTPRDAVAWMGLAASYDRLNEFDKADQAYSQAERLTGRNVVWLNNRGYSYLLRGNLRQAHSMFSEAYALDPTNVTIANNLQLLAGSRDHVSRLPEAY